MIEMNLKNRFTAFILSFFFITNIVAQTNYQQTTSPTYKVIPSYTDQELEVRVNALTGNAVKPKLDAVVKSYVNTYTIKRRAKTEKMLGKLVMYFPMFEKYLLENNMPMDIKYLSVVESALNPIAVSRAGATGLWQFMPATGKEYGLDINTAVDERRDPHKSTKAAITYLKRLYNKYQDWELALAAYNSGPGNVNRAIRRGRSKNFWKIKKYLPRETRNYVPAFVAANYIVNYYEHHNLDPQYPSLEMQLTETTRVYRSITFQEISEITGTPIHVIEALNPCFKRRMIPHSREGHYLMLPRHNMPAYLAKFARPDSGQTYYDKNVNVRQRYFSSVYYVQAGDNIDKIAKIFECHRRHIMAWNDLSQPYLSQGQELVVYQLSTEITPPPVQSIPTTPIQVKLEKPKPEKIIKEATVLGLNNNKNTASSNVVEKEIIEPKKRKKVIRKKEKYIYHFIQRNESLIDVADKYPGVSVEDILEINKIKKNSLPSIGNKIKIKKIL